MKIFIELFHRMWSTFLNLLLPAAHWFDRQSLRRRIAYEFLSGTGLEIGALHRPMIVPSRAKVEYVDRESNEALALHYPWYQARHLVPVTYVTNGETLEIVPDASKDFVIASHMIEHAENPVQTLLNWFRVLKPGGILYLLVPDKRYTWFDNCRPVTTLEHIRRDFEETPEWSRRPHYRQWARAIEGLPKAEEEARAIALEKEGFSIHFHTFTPLSFASMLMYCADQFPFPFDIELIRRSNEEFIVVLRKMQG